MTEQNESEVATGNQLRRPPWDDPVAHVIGDALTSLGDGEYITSFDEEDTFERVVTVLTEYVRAYVDSGDPETP